MFTNPAATAIKYLILLIGLLVVGLLLFAPRTEAQEASTVGNSLTVSVDTLDESHNVDFDFYLDRIGSGTNPGAFTLRDGSNNDHEFDLDDGSYVLTVDLPSGWAIDSLKCSPKNTADFALDKTTGEIKFSVDGDGDHYECAYVFERVDPTATPSATATPVPATATATPAATATSVPVLQPKVFVSCPDGSLHEAPYTCPAPVLTTVPQTQIKPPSVGDGGLLP